MLYSRADDDMGIAVRVVENYSLDYPYKLVMMDLDADLYTTVLYKDLQAAIKYAERFFEFN